VLLRRLKSLRVIVALAVFAGLTAAFVDFRGALPPQIGHWLASAQFVPSTVALVKLPASPFRLLYRRS
jgi:hypothetical protein